METATETAIIARATDRLFLLSLHYPPDSPTSPEPQPRGLTLFPKPSPGD